MRKATMPVPYIIALIIGVVVVAVLAYWFIYSGSKGSSIGTEAECTARKTEYCVTQTDDVWGKITTKCGGFDNCYDFCSSIIPGWKSTNPRCEPPPPP